MHGLMSQQGATHSTGATLREMDFRMGAGSGRDG